MVAFVWTQCRDFLICCNPNQPVTFKLWTQKENLNQASKLEQRNGNPKVTQENPYRKVRAKNRARPNPTKESDDRRSIFKIRP